MKWRRTSLLAMLAALVAPSALSACDTYLGYLFMRTTLERMAFGGGIQIQPGEDGGATYLIPSVDLSIPVGERAVVKPMLGYCVPSGGDGEDEDSEIVFGGGGAVNLWNNPDGTLSINVQAALTAYSYEGGSEQVVPLSVAGAFAASESASLVFGAGLQIGRYSYDFEGFSDSGTDSDPFAFVGALFGAGGMGLQLGLAIKKGDSDTDLAFNGGLGIPLG